MTYTPFRVAIPLTTSFADAFTVPANTTALVSNIQAANIDGAVSVDVSAQWLTPTSQATALAWLIPVREKQATGLVGGGLILTAGDRLQGRASVTSDAVMTVAGFYVTETQFPPPEFTIAPSISPSSGAEDDEFTANTGSATETTSYTIRWLLDGVVISTNPAVVPGAQGDLVLEVTATGPNGSTVATTDAIPLAPSGMGWVINDTGGYVLNSSGGKIAAPSE